VVPVEHADLGAVLSVPDVDPPVGRPRYDELRVGRERCLEGDALRDEDRLAIGTELEARPINVLLGGELEGRKRALVEAPEVVKLDALGVDARGKDEPLGVESGHRAARQVHEALAVCRPQIPEPDGFVQAAAEEGLVGGRHAERHDPLAVSAKVADVLVLRDVKVADDVVLLGAAVHDVRLVGREVDDDLVVVGGGG